MKKFENIKNIGKLSSFPHVFVFVNKRLYSNRPYFKAHLGGAKYMVVRLSGALTEAFDNNLITHGELYDCDVVLLDTTAKIPEYALKIPVHLIPLQKLIHKELSEI